MILTLKLGDTILRQLEIEADGENVRFDKITLTPVDTLEFTLNLPTRLYGLSLLDRFRILFNKSIVLNVGALAFYAGLKVKGPSEIIH